MEYSILDEKYFLFTVIYLYVSLLLIITIFVATESLMILWLQHAASLCEIIRFLQDIRDYNAITYCVLLILAITSLGINFFRLSQSILVLTKIEETIISLMCIICELSYMYYMNYICQLVLDCFNNLNITIFHTNWYKMSVPIQKLILNIMLNCNKPLLLTFLSVYCPTMEGFASVSSPLFYNQYFLLS
ncbi:uncharacterized protein LOC105735644 isoform X2 [Apis florea]|uniref:uncharacterized protein LOC105735644 isoform X2 n=1 Tax=Apis florea TaxID=7463 RepID=UPI0012FEE3B6|nr:uncharacterized protein LOC105735644 isoform X2 [Apis florea]